MYKRQAPLHLAIAEAAGGKLDDAVASLRKACQERNALTWWFARYDPAMEARTIFRAYRQVSGGVLWEPANRFASHDPPHVLVDARAPGVRVGVVRPGPSSTEQGTHWDVGSVLEIMESWGKFGLLRHSGALRPTELAEAVLAMVSVPRGTRWAVLEVQPEAPVVATAEDEETK